MKCCWNLVSTLVLLGCGESTSFQDLERFIGQTYATAEVTSTGLPPEPNYQSLAFIAKEKGDPFIMPLRSPQSMISRKDCWQPDMLTTQDVLQQYELSSMAFKGVIGEPGNYWALLETPDHAIHRVGIGRVLGVNKGRVDSISQKTLSITEHFSDGLGCWQTKNIRLALASN